MPFKGFKTYYRIVGEPSGQAPLLLLHGGPGSTHNYFEVLDCLADTGRQIITYDQLGCGNSYVDGHPELWTLEVWCQELAALRDHLGLNRVHLLGQSWGGMLILGYLSDWDPRGIESIILSSTLPSSALWAREQHRMIRQMSPEDQKAIAEAEATGNFDSPAFRKANDLFMELHCASDPAPTDPECLRREKRSGEEAYLTAWGPNEYTPNGTLKDFDYTDRLGQIQVPALVISGTDDMCTPLIAKTMYDAIPNSRWELFEGCRHMSFVEEHDKYCALISEWLAGCSVEA